ncbi:MAG: HDIG domain-containing protein [Coriobacteriia bacterium]|nr:HDIG domain-containing protein [Coriobacteriia bacterium]
MGRYREITDNASRLVARSVKTSFPSQPIVYASIVLASALIVLAGGAVAWLLAAALGASDEVIAAAAFVGAVGAATATAIGLIIVPFIRDSLGLTEDIRLLEAASPAHPLMRELITVAPGTYTHSVAVANLAEAAAEALGADPLVTRVGAYYHDIGKVRRPLYFFENQRPDFNPHDQTDAIASALIITAHVNDGIALADRYRLPPKVIAIIRQHHGTSLVRYFYNKAALADAAVYEADFRYRGELPSTREAALVMTADACEAAVRAIQHPTEGRVGAVVRSVVSEKLADGQLAQAGLTSDELDTIESIYIRTLVGMYHARCEYPPIPEILRRPISADQHHESPRT